MSIAQNLTTIAENVPKVYEAGKKAEYDDFWDGVQQNGKREDYDHGFRMWGNVYIRPKYKVVPTGSTTCHQYMFYECPNLKKIEAQYFDFSKISGLSQTSNSDSNRQIFQRCTAIEEIEDIGMPAGMYYYTFGNCPSLHTIAVVRVKQTTTYTGAFGGCSSLTNISFDGAIGRSINLSVCPLSKESLKNITEHLFDYTGTSEYTYTLTVNTSAFEALEAEGATAEYNGVACTWAELIDNKKWNLVKG